jgi:hypothetical protein
LNVYLKGEGVRAVSGKLPTSLNIIRAVAGLSLPVRCTVVQGVSVGSCSYADACKDILQDIAEITPEDCPADLIPLGIDCNCPFNIPTQVVDGSIEFAVSDLSTSIVSFLASGDFDVTARVNQANGVHVACLNLKFTVKKAAKFNLAL